MRYSKMTEKDIATPAVVIDLGKVRRNVLKLAEYGRKHKVGIRPHTKTHKSVGMARLQLENGAVGLTVAKAGEAEIMTGAGDDILIAYPAFDPHRRMRVAEL